MSLIPNSNTLPELTRIFQDIEAQLRALKGNKYQGASNSKAASAVVAPLALASPAAPANADLTSIYARLTTVEGILPSLAPLDSPAFTGVPTAPTAPEGTSSNQLATCAFTPPAGSGSGQGYFPSGW